MVEGPGADSEEKHEPVSDIDTAAADSLKVLDLKRPIREADIAKGLSGAKLGNTRVTALERHCWLAPLHNPLSGQTHRG